MTDLTPLSQALTHDGSYIHECIWITWKLNKSINQSIKPPEFSSVDSTGQLWYTKIEIKNEFHFYQELSAFDCFWQEWRITLSFVPKRGHSILTKLAQRNLNDTRALTQSFSFGGGGDDPEAICNIWFILKNFIKNQVTKNSFATSYIYIYKEYCTWIWKQ